MAETPAAVVRPATPSDGPALTALIDALADYEKLERPSEAARDRLQHDLFGPKPRIECHLALLGSEAVGYSILLETYSSFLALPTLYLEDLFVLPAFRGRRVGYALFEEARREARRRGCGRMEWTVLSWNRLAIDFYNKAGGKHVDEWQLFRISF